VDTILRHFEEFFRKRLLPVYLVTVLGTSTLTVGFIEGIAEATANITKIVGAFVGPLAAIALMALSSNNFRFVFRMAVCRRSSLAVMMFVVEEPAGLIH
jgi:hypothetical protein